MEQVMKIAIRYEEKGNYHTNQPIRPGSRRMTDVKGYQMLPYLAQILKIVLGSLVRDIPRSRTVTYQYLEVAESITWSRAQSYFVTDVTQTQLERIEQITKSVFNPGVYLWMQEQWWKFPQKEEYKTGKMLAVGVTTIDIFGSEQSKQHSTVQIEERAKRIVEHYKPTPGPGFAPVPQATSARSYEKAAPPDAGSSATNPAGYPIRIEGNDMVLLWKQGYADKPPIWWLEDIIKVSNKARSATFKNYETIKNTSASRWSKSFKAWYYTGGSVPPEQWLKLVGWTGSVSSGAASPSAPLLDEQVSPTHVEFPAAAVMKILEADEQTAGRSYNLPISLIEEQQRKYPYAWNNANPMIWARLFCEQPNQEWIFLVADYSPVKNEVFGHFVHLDERFYGDKFIAKREWIWKPLDELEVPHIYRVLNFTPEPSHEQISMLLQMCGGINLLDEEQLLKDQIQADMKLRDKELPSLKQLGVEPPFPCYRVNTNGQDLIVEVVKIHDPAFLRRFATNRTAVAEVEYQIKGGSDITRVTLDNFAIRVAYGNAEQDPLPAYAEVLANLNESIRRYHEIQAYQAFLRNFTERTQYLTSNIKLLPAQVILIDDPWG